MHDDLVLHNEHKDWLRILDFYENEIEFFYDSLDRVFDKNIADVTRVGHSAEYITILKKKKKRIKKLRKIILEHQKSIAGEDKGYDLEIHEMMVKKMNKFVSGFEKMKKSFRKFASKND